MKGINRNPGVLMNICVKWYSPMTSNDFVITVTSKDRRINHFRHHKTNIQKYTK